MEEPLKHLMNLACFAATIFFCLFQNYLERIPCIKVIMLDFDSLPEWIPMLAALVWSAVLIVLNFKPKDVNLILLLSATVLQLASNKTQSSGVADALVFTSAILVGRFTSFLFRTPTIRMFSVLVFFLALSSWWHLDMSNNFYHGPRWMGLWNNPNIYGMLMGVGVALAIGLLIGERARPGRSLARPASNANAVERPKYFGRLFVVCSLREKFGAPPRRTAVGAVAFPVFLFIAVFMMGVGLVMSYSRGAWLATVIGLLYLAWCHGKLKWRFVLPGIVAMAAVVLYFWGHTPDSAPWFVKRTDLGRPSAQHRVTAWRAGLEIMRDHPFGVGWNNAVSLYDKSYSPPEGRAAALTTNDYLIIGTELGMPALLCFVAYLAMCYRKSPGIQNLETKSQKGLNAAVPAAGSGELLLVPPVGTPALPCNPSLVTPHSSLLQEHESLRAACLSGALVLIVAFWFDGGLFKLATAAVFWILLELGTSDFAVRNS
jgi:hypothetical protein